MIRQCRATACEKQALRPTRLQEAPLIHLADKRVLVIGGSSGIGYEVARLANAQGARLILAGRNEVRLAGAAERLGAVDGTAVVDAHDGVALESFFATLDPIDHIVSMVGDSMSGGFLTTPLDTARHVLHSKLWTNWMIARLAAPKLREGGSLVYTSGTGAYPHEASATYVANLGIR